MSLHRRVRLAVLSLLVLAIGALAPSAASAQLGVAGRFGTLGLGAEGALALSDRFVLRGGASLSKLDVDVTLNDVPVVVRLPRSWYNLGVDFYLNSAFRIGGGIAFKPDDPFIRGNIREPVEIGGVLLTPEQIGTLTGTIDMDDRAAFALIGFGKHTAEGAGLFVDAGAVIMGSPGVRLTAEGGSYPQDALDQLLAREAQSFEDELAPYFRVWPILNIGLRIGIAY